MATLAGEAEAHQRRYRPPYTALHPIPTIQNYEQEKEERRITADQYSPEEDEDKTDQYLHHSNDDNLEENSPEKRTGLGHRRIISNKEEGGGKKSSRLTEDTSEVALDQNPKTRRKAIQKRRGSRVEREVTDPITHLPVRIHDFQVSDLKNVPQNLDQLDFRTLTGLAGKSKSDEELQIEAAEMERYHCQIENLFPPPEYEAIKQQLTGVYSKGIVAGLISMATAGYTFLTIERAIGGGDGIVAYMVGNVISFTGIITLFAIILAVRTWMSNKIDGIWKDELWHAQKHQPPTKPFRGFSANDSPESTHWLNNLLASIWPLVNPDLFVSLADTLEDVMQASLPSIVRMVSIEDIGQGSESIRILGVRWLPTGAASRSVDPSGQLSKQGNDQPHTSDIHGYESLNASVETSEKSNQDPTVNNETSQQLQAKVTEGMEAEEGDFINFEVAFSYRTRSSSPKFRDRAKHAHLYIAFYLPGRIKLPVYVDLKGLVGIARVRLQLTPDPPFFRLMTLTFLGQPKVDVRCVPLNRNGLNIMDLPIISNFVQSAVDAAMAEYVAPKSLTLNLKDMLSGEDFKKDTQAYGIIVCRIKRAFNFKEGDPAIPLIREGTADPYVTVGWAKFVKPLWSTRVILSEMDPHWEEFAFIPVTPDVLDVDERLRVQLWDSDRLTADDDLGRIEMEIKDVMGSPATHGKMCDRIDGFKALKAGHNMPGKLEWSVGYFPKTQITDLQLQLQTAEPSIRTKQDLDERVRESSERKLRETKKDETREKELLRQQQQKEIEDKMIASAPPLQDFPCGLISVQIHEATGLEVRAMHNADRYNRENERSDEEEQSDELPSSYCNIIINHQMAYRTRIKPKNQKPFFNAGTERFIRDWRETVIYIAVRDSRVHEDDPLIGIVCLRLADVLSHESRQCHVYPLYGGVGYGKVRVSIIFRSVDLQLPPNMIGWEYGTLAIKPEITGKNISPDLHGLRLKLQTSITIGHMYGRKADTTNEHVWASTKEKRIFLAVRKRYSSALVIQFRKDRHFLDKTAAFSVLWLTDLIDDKEMEVTLPVWKGDLKRATTCYLRECGERVGEITLKLTFYKGLNRAHKKLVSKDPHLREVIEVIETSRYATRARKDEIGAVANIQDEQEDSADSSSDDDNNDDDSDSSSSRRKKAQKKEDEIKTLQQDGRRSLRNSWKEYRSDYKQQHRRHRGIMQYKGVRTMWWMKHKAENVQDRISGVFDHDVRQMGIETEAS